ncbi:MAG: hypothetical protein WBI06_10695 [Paludibacter sp.]
MIEILKIGLPALLVFLTAYLLIDKLLRNDENRRNFEISKKNVSIITPIRLRAYERLMLVLERTSPNSIVINTIKSGMTCIELQTQLLNNIRQEFAHNASQQIYVSDELWAAIRATQESLIQLINGCASKIQPESNAVSLAELIIQVFASSELTPTETTTELLKKEVRSLM